MNHRTGATLIEVLVSIFIMAVGLLALLTLFPIGILTMQQAIINDRTAHSTATADAAALAMNVRYDPLLDTMFKNPNNGIFVDAWEGGPSHPLFVDPVGSLSYLPPYSQWVGGFQRGIPRVSTTFVAANVNQPVFPDPKRTQRWFTSMDDLVFDKAGIPDQIQPQVFDRVSAFSWAYLLRRPLQGAPGVVNMSVVVYYKRPISLTNALQTGEAIYDATFSPADSTISLAWGAGQSPPNLNLGNWILDTTPVLSSRVPNKFGPSHANFYRVVGLTETGPNSLTLEVQTPIQDFPLPPPTPQDGTTNFTGKVLIMDGIVGVFDKSGGWRP